MRSWTFRGGAGALLLAGLALAAGTAGNLDPTFGSGGVVVSVEPDNGQLLAVATQADGSVVAVGQAVSPDHWRIRRFHGDGSPDTAFNGTAELGITGGVARRVAVDAAGRIIVAGTTTIQKTVKGKTSTVVVVALVRLLADGSFDPTFGAGGKVLTEAGPIVTDVLALHVQPDGRILVGGNTGVLRKGFYTKALLLIRYLSDGSLDSTFGASGLVMDDVTTGEDDVRGVALQSTGRIVVACRFGTTNKDPARFAVLRRYMPGGTLDTTFGSAGTLVSAGDMFSRVAVDAQDRIVAVGSVLDAQNFSDAGLVVRYTSGGTVDTSFANGGEFIANITAHEDFHRVSLLPDGRIMLLGRGGSPQYTWAVRLDASGAPDLTFGGDGFGDQVQADGVADMAVDAAGNAVMGGDDTPDDNWVLARWCGN